MANMTVKEAHDARLAGAPLRFAVQRLVQPLPGHSDSVYNTVSWAVIDQDIMGFMVQTFSTEDAANAAADELNATRDSGEHDLRTLVHPLTA